MVLPMQDHYNIDNSQNLDTPEGWTQEEWAQVIASTSSAIPVKTPISSPTPFHPSEVDRENVRLCQDASDMAFPRLVDPLEDTEAEVQDITDFINAILPLREEVAHEGPIFYYLAEIDPTKAKDAKDRLSPCWSQTRDELIQKAKSIRKNGKNVYVAISVFSRMERKAEFALGSKVIHMDRDCGDGKEFPEQKDAWEAIYKASDALGVFPLVIDSGNGLQDFILLDRFVTREEWKKLCLAVAQLNSAHGCKYDNAVVGDAARFMRLPGTRNFRDPSSPKKAQILHHGQRVNVDDLKERLNKPEAAAPLSVIPSSPRVQKADANDDFLPPSDPESQENVERVKSALFAIPGFDDREKWLRVGMMLHSTGWDSAFDLWTRWSKRSEKYDEADQRRVWQSFKSDGSLTIATLFHLARENGWNDASVAQSGRADAGANGLQFSEVLRDGRPKLTHANVMAAISHKYMGRVRQNTFSYKLELDGCPIDDTDYARIMVDLSEAYGLNAPKGLVADFVGLLAQDASYHPVQEYLRRLHWDGKDRIGKLFDDYFMAAEPSEYSRRVAEIFLIGAVARAMRPGCKVDTMLILEGRQGLNKSTGLRALFGADWFVEVLSSPDSKDFFTDIQGAWCVEFAELSQMKGVRDARRLKQIITQQSDTFTPKYERTARTFPRQCVFTGTTNESEYLSDPTGARRFLPVELTAVNVERIIQDRDQIWAQAVRLFEQGADFWTLPEGHDGVVAEKYETDAWETRIIEAIESHGTAKPLTAKVLYDGLLLGMKDIGRAEQTRIGNIMRSLGYHKVRQAGGAREYHYVKN